MDWSGIPRTSVRKGSGGDTVRVALWGGDARLFCLIYYDESAGTWRNLDYLDSLYGEGWSQQNVNPGNVYAEKWACSINTIPGIGYYVYRTRIL